MMGDIIQIIFSSEFLWTVIRASTTLVLATLGAHISLKAGIINIGLEGILITGALVGVLFSAFIVPIVGSHAVALILTFLVVVLAGAGAGLFIGIFHLKLDADIALTGIVFNLIDSGLTIFMLFIVTGDKGVSSSLQSLVFPNIDIPLIKSIPFIGDILSGHNLLTYFAFFMVLVIWFILNKTTFGLRIRAVGESPETVQSVGINVHNMKLMAISISGALAAVGGMYLSMGYTSFFVSNMSSGRGFIALSANAMGGSTVGGMLVSMLFGFAETLAIFLELNTTIPGEIVSMSPFIFVIVALVFFSWSKKRKNLK